MDWTKAWQHLCEESGTQAGWLTRRIYPESACDVRAGILQPQKIPGLLIEMPAASIPPRLDPPTSKGFKLDIETLKPGPSGRVRLSLVLAAREYLDVFKVLANDVSEKIAASRTEQDGLSALMSRLRVWQLFFKNAGQGLSAAAILGMAGELALLTRVLLPELDEVDVLAAWRGPAGAVQDFRWQHLAVEVKTTCYHPPNQITINRLAQLDETALEHLFLAHVAMSKDHPNGKSLNQMVDAALDRLKDPEAISMFKDRLLQIGYLMEDRSRYDGYIYRLDHIQFFKVEADFPRMRPCDVLTGIVDATYQISYPALTPYEKQMSHFLNLLQGDH